MIILVDQNSIGCFIDQNSVNCFIDQNSAELCCGAGSALFRLLLRLHR